MASLSDDPRQTQQVQGARRDFSLLNRGYRMAKRKGDIAGALKYAQAGDSMGIPVGRVANDRVLEGAGRRRFQMGLQVSGGQERRGGLDGFDFRHSSQGGPGVGGYDFRQAKDRFADQEAPVADGQPNQAGGTPGNVMPDEVLMGAAQPESPAPSQASTTTLLPRRPSIYQGGGMTSPGAASAPDASQAANAPSLMRDRSRTPSLPAESQDDPASVKSRFQKAWHSAGTQDEKDEIVARAFHQNIPMNAEATRLALARRSKRQGLISRNTRI
jgi:hypothetical protein